ncbi:AAA family ATPase [Blastococcus sp. Marseille-P5729]|uniref:AAA family ATPase n=1 Tax=Blastococcus sp. Marseille-P5729 TaxID=2086582 RepID=UPI0018FE12B2|nr:AAA family ATPase [Blastococcus sp. Marseille-P5729]
MADQTLTLTARLTAAVLDARRGIVRMHRDVMSALDLAPWDPVLLEGTRTTGAIVAEGGPDVPAGILLCDDLTLGNAGLQDGTAIKVSKLPLVEARSVELSAGENITRIISPDMLRRALLGKMVTAGDDISLLPLDGPAHEGDSAALAAARRQLKTAMGMQWTTTLVEVTKTDSTTPVLVTGGTTVSWKGGASAPGWQAGTSTPPTSQLTAQAPSAAAANGLITVTPTPDRPGQPTTADQMLAGARTEPAAGVSASTAPTAPVGPTGSAVGGQAQATATRPGQRSDARPAAEALETQNAEPAKDVSAHAIPTVKELPGVKAQADSLTEWFDLGFHHRDVLASLGSKPQLGVLVSGPPGVGKATLVRAVAAHVGAGVVELSAPTIAAIEAATAADTLRSAVSQAAGQSPSVLLIQDVEALAPREDPDPISRIFIDLLARTVDEGQVAVVCTTARPEEVSTELTRPGLLDHQLSLPLPDRAMRKQILESLLRPVPLADDVNLDDVAGKTPGFVAADLIALRREASVRAALRQKESEKPTVAQEDLVGALDVVRPTAMAESTLEVARVSLEDVGDMADTKKALTEAVLWPLQYPDTYERLGISPPRGVLLYGPPGCGKTFIVKAIAGSGQTNVMSVKGAELLNKWVGESERAVRELFRRARQAAPTLIFMDEVDALAPPRGQGTDGGTTDRVVASLLTELDGVEALNNVFVIGATNRPDLVDPAMLRPGRLDKMIYVPPPDAEARTAILKTTAKNTPITRGVDFEEIGQELEGYSSADCAALVREAALVAMRRDMDAPKVTKADFDQAMKNIKGSLDPEQVAWLENFAEQRELS